MRAVFHQNVVSFYDLFIFNQNFEQEIIAALKRREPDVSTREGRKSAPPVG